MRNRQSFLLVILFPLLAGCSQWKASITRVDGLTAVVPESEISVVSSSGSVTVNGSEIDKIQVEATIKSFGLTEDSAKELLDQTTIVMDEKQGILTISADTPPSFRGSVNFLIDVPAGLACRIKTSNGKIIATGTRANVSAASSNGAIELDDVMGKIEAATSNGRITIHAFDQSSIQAKTSNGKIIFQGELVGDTNQFVSSNGSIELEVVGGPVSYAIATSNGSISVNGKKAKVGRISVDSDGNIQPENSDTGAAATIATSNGNISIMPKSNTSD